MCPERLPTMGLRGPQGIYQGRPRASLSARAMRNEPSGSTGCQDVRTLRAHHPPRVPPFPSRGPSPPKLRTRFTASEQVRATPPPRVWRPPLVDRRVYSSTNRRECATSKGAGVRGLTNGAPPLPPNNNPSPRFASHLNLLCSKRCNNNEAGVEVASGDFFPKTHSTIYCWFQS